LHTYSGPNASYVNVISIINDQRCQVATPERAGFTNKIDRLITADLHSHTRASDGSLTAPQLLEIAEARGVNLFAITDHDSARERRVNYVAGVEISAQWRDVPIHIVGLNINEADTSLVAALSSTRAMRTDRAKAMGVSLATSGIADAFEGARKHATHPELISRTHFARHLVDSGVCASNSEVFSRYMKPGKPGYVPVDWMKVEAAIALIHGAGGSAVLAHAARYDTEAHGGVNSLISDFKNLGGDAIEVICSGHSPSDWANFAALARRFELKASIGSDFHSHAESKVRIGDLPRLSPSLTPVWQDWSIAHNAVFPNRR
jgi:3',5'-nucleoside bisphosphate phosphatase